MSSKRQADFFGPFQIIRPLGMTRGVERFVVLCNKTDTNRLLYRFPAQSNHMHRRSRFEQMVTLSMLNHPHLLKVESASYDDRGRLCTISPYPGNHEGLVRLSDLLDQHGGKFTVPEAARAIEHLLSASAYAHSKELVHGPVLPEHVLVDRFGAVQIELYGHQHLERSSTNTTAHLHRADEVRSIADIGYKLLTGLDNNAERIAPTRIIKRLDRQWDTWFDIALDPIDGFADAQHALNALPTNPSASEWLSTSPVKRAQVHIGSVMRKFRASTQSHSK